MSRPMVNEAQFSIRMPKDFVERADRLAEVLVAGGLGAVTVTRAMVFRLALARGLVALETESLGGRQRKVPPARKGRGRRS